MMVMMMMMMMMMIMMMMISNTRTNGRLECHQVDRVTQSCMSRKRLSSSCECNRGVTVGGVTVSNGTDSNVIASGVTVSGVTVSGVTVSGVTVRCVRDCDLTLCVTVNAKTRYGTGYELTLEKFYKCSLNIQLCINQQPGSELHSTE